MKIAAPDPGYPSSSSSLNVFLFNVFSCHFIKWVGAFEKIKTLGEANGYSLQLQLSFVNS